MSDLVAIRKNVPSVAVALRSLTAMERELTTAKTYDTIRRVIKEATALKVLMGDVAEVKAAAEDAILIGNRRIAEELAKVPKATGRLPKNFAAGRNSKTGKADTGIKKDVRSRIGKLADKSTAEIKATAARLREQGKDATVTAVVREITQGSKKERRMERERDLAARQRALPDRKYGVILADPAWKFEAWSEETGSDRAAANHYPVSTWQTIETECPVWEIAARDAVLFLWATVPMLPQALEVMKAWSFRYRSHVVWAKDRIGTGYWFRNRHELLLVGARGDLPAPAPGTQWPSVVEAPAGRHSEKPEVFLEMIEAYFPSLPRIELNRRGPPRAGWDAWGNEAEPAEAADD